MDMKKFVQFLYNSLQRSAIMCGEETQGMHSIVSYKKTFTATLNSDIVAKIGKIFCHC